MWSCARSETRLRLRRCVCSRCHHAVLLSRGGTPLRLRYGFVTAVSLTCPCLRRFRSGSYSSLVFAASSVLVPDGTVETLVWWLDTGRHSIALPVSTLPSVASGPLNVETLFRMDDSEASFVRAAANVQTVQDRLQWLFASLPPPPGMPAAAAAAAATTTDSVSSESRSPSRLFTAPLNLGLSTRMSVGHRVKVPGVVPVLDAMPHGAAAVPLHTVDNSPLSWGIPPDRDAPLMFAVSRSVVMSTAGDSVDSEDGTAASVHSLLLQALAAGRRSRVNVDAPVTDRADVVVVRDCFVGQAEL